MHSDDMQARYNHMNLARTHHQSRMHHASRIDYDYVPYVAHTTRRDRMYMTCLLYTSPSPRDATLSRMPSSA